MIFINNDTTKKRDVGIIPFILFLVSFLYLCIWTVPSNINGDALIHVSNIREIAETGDILSSYPHTIMDVNDGERIKYPITYPQIFYTVLTPAYMIGGENMLKLFSPLCGALIAVFVYLLVRPINKHMAIAAGFAAMMINTSRIIMTPLFEEYLLVAAVISIYFYYLFVSTMKWKFLVLTALFLGLVASTKQQGLIFFGVIVLHAVALALYPLVKKDSYNYIKPAIVLVLLSMIVIAGPVYKQIEQNGTIAFVPGGQSSSIPFLDSKYPENAESLDEIADIVSWPEYNSIIDVMGIYFLHPTTYGSSLTDNPPLFYPFFLIMLGLFVAGIIFMWRKKRILLGILLPIFLAEMLSAYIVGTPVRAYQVISLTIMAVFLIIGIWYAAELASSRFPRRITISSILLALLITVIACHEYRYNDSGRCDDIHVAAYEEIGDYIEENASSDALLIGTTEGFRHYSLRGRDMIWINEGGGAKIPLIFRTTDEEESLSWLKYYDIDYIFVETRQIGHGGYWDYIPEEGLMKYIDESPHFKRAHSVIMSDDDFILYKVIYDD